MHIDPVEMISEMGLFGLLIVLSLLVMGFGSLAVFFERLWVFYRTRKKSIEFSRKAYPHLEKHDYAALAEVAGEEKANHLATLLGSGAQTYLKNAEIVGELTPVELARREMERQSDAVAAKLRRGLNVVASVGSIAPFTGLLGTVVGIMGAFQGIAAKGSGGLGAVSGGISEALVVTALGLVIAIPAVLMFNVLSAKADFLEMALDQSRGEFVDHIEADQSVKRADVERSASASEVGTRAA